jgi:CRP-like cAMP-binding protein
MRQTVSATLFSAQQYAACNLKHTLLQRCARWLLMTADRAGGPEFVLTHEFLSIMLGVRRAGVSEAAGSLHSLGAVSYNRGKVTVLDAVLLEGASCECYRSCKTAFELSPPG